ncbi:uncharacterized protein LOC122023971 [Zingiber officinale]|nr:uncharacterized protein LOC122023971 [Zingiber officinale]
MNQRGGALVVDQEAAPPHGILLAVVVGLVVAAPFLVGGEAITGAVADLLSPAGLLLLPVLLILLIRFLSSDRGVILSEIFASGSPDSIHRVGGSPVGVALLLLLILILLYYRFSIFGGDASGDAE